VLAGHEGPVKGAFPLDDQRILSWSDDGTWRIWSPEGAATVVVDAHGRKVAAVKRFPDHRLLSWKKNGTTLGLWSEQGQLLATLTHPDVAILGAEILPGDRVLSWGKAARGTDHPMRIWSSEGAVIKTLRGHTSVVHSVEELPDGSLVSLGGSDFYSEDCTLRLWTAEGDPLAVLEGHTRPPRGVRVLPDGRLVSWSTDGTLRVWAGGREGQRAASVGLTLTLAVPVGLSRLDIEGPCEGIQKRPSVNDRGYLIDEHPGGVFVSAGGRILSWTRGAGADPAVRVLTSFGDPIATLDGHSDSVEDAAVTADGRVLTWSRDGTIRLWSPDGLPLAVLRGHSANVIGCRELPDGRLVSWADDHDCSLRLWSRDGALLRVQDGHRLPIRGVRLTPGGQLLSWCPRTVRVWSLEGLEVGVLVDSDKALIRDVLALPSGRFVTLHDNYSLHIWAAGGTLVSSSTGRGFEYAAALSNDRLLCWSFGALRLLSADGALLSAYEHDQLIHGAGQTGTGRICVWNEDNLWVFPHDDLGSGPPEGWSLRGLPDDLVAEYLNAAGLQRLMLWGRPVRQAGGQLVFAGAVWQTDQRPALLGCTAEGTIVAHLVGGDLACLKVMSGGDLAGGTARFQATPGIRR
jgi:WD40 repeat protein